LDLDDPESLEPDDDLLLSDLPLSDELDEFDDELEEDDDPADDEEVELSPPFFGP
jgi:hypothetical protein